MVFSTLWTKTTFHSQSTATSVPSPVWHGLWSSPTPFKISSLLENHFTYTTCQSTKMHLNGTTIVFPCPVYSQFKTSQHTGEVLVIFQPMALTTGITGESPLLIWIFWWSLQQQQVACVFYLSLSTYVEIAAPTAQFWLVTVTTWLFTWTAGSMAVILTGNLGPFLMKTTSELMYQLTLLSGALLPWIRLLSSGLEGFKCEKQTKNYETKKKKKLESFFATKGW